jgi:2-oxo-4-hydroxy-4-carboxy-5-ureidoimidazoline decarboxylase
LPNPNYSPALAEFNDADADALTARLLQLTHSPQWATELLIGRPYADLAGVLRKSDAILANVGEDQIDAALAGHPRIGESGANLGADAAARSAGEQAGMHSADSVQRSALAEANADYEQNFGRIYLVAAAGLSAAELLAEARARLGNDPETELAVVRGELAKITRHRLTNLLTEESAS